ncbi:MAG: cytochrome c oxidase subunit II [Flavihumibacter sp.]|nr:cytochrome c oxidase subunit II [Flavihumibacter sp.]
MTTIFILAILLLGFLITFQIAKASEYVAVLKGEKKTFEQNNRINGFLLLIFLVLGMAGVYWCNELYKGKILGEAASDHGVDIDRMLYISIIITGIVFVLTQVLLFWFAYKYQYSEKRKAFYFPHNNKLELVWTVVPAIFLTVLVGFGLFYWYKITGDAPANATVVEVTGKQFGWYYRYPGKDGVFGKKYYKNISDAKDNSLGLIWDDKAAQDDIVRDDKLMLVVNKPVKLVINSRDVIHDVGLVHFRMKMDAVPGTPTTMWFTPRFTTKEMKEKTGNPNFVYEISCDQMCGKGHYSMRGVVEVVSQAEYDAYMIKQEPKYKTAVLDKLKEAAPAADTTAKAIAAVEKN